VDTAIAALYKTPVLVKPVFEAWRTYVETSPYLLGTEKIVTVDKKGDDSVSRAKQHGDLRVVLKDLEGLASLRRRARIAIPVVLFVTTVLFPVVSLALKTSLFHAPIKMDMFFAPVFSLTIGLVVALLINRKKDGFLRTEHAKNLADLIGVLKGMISLKEKEAKQRVADLDKPKKDTARIASEPRSPISPAKPRAESRTALLGASHSMSATSLWERPSQTISQTRVAVSVVNGEDRPLDLPHLLTDLKFLIAVKYLRFGILPQVVADALSKGYANAGDRVQRLMVRMGFTLPSAMASTPETAILDQYFAPRERLEIKTSPNDVKSAGTFYLGGNLMNRVVRENPDGLLFYILKYYRAQAAASGVKVLLETSAKPGFLKDVLCPALLKRGAVAPKDFAERDAIVEALKQGEILRVNELAAGQSELSMVKGRIARLDGKIATLFDDENILAMLEGGNNFAVTANVGTRDMSILGKLMTKLFALAELSGDPLVRAVQDLVPGYGKNGSGFTINALSLATLAQEFVRDSLIGKSA